MILQSCDFASLTQCCISLTEFLTQTSRMLLFRYPYHSEWVRKCAKNTSKISGCFLDPVRRRFDTYGAILVASSGEQTTPPVVTTKIAILNRFHHMMTICHLYVNYSPSFHHSSNPFLFIMQLTKNDNISRHSVHTVATWSTTQINRCTLAT